MPSRPPKKSETIEIRLSWEAKRAFVERCRDDRESASEAIRRFIDESVGARPAPARPRSASWRMLIAAMIGALLGLGAAAPSLAGTADHSRAAFERLDRNHDGMLSFAEYHAG